MSLVLLRIEKLLEKIVEKLDSIDKKLEPTEGTTESKEPQMVTKEPIPIDVKECFPEELWRLLTFTEVQDKDGDYIKVLPKSFLGNENFAKVAKIVEELKGNYISAGKDSHFRIPKQPEMK